MKNIILILFLYSSVSFSESPKEEIERVAMQYIPLMFGGEESRAIDEYWHMPTILQDTLGEEFLSISVNDKSYVTSLVTTFFKINASILKGLDAYSQSVPENMEMENLPRNRYLVRFDLKLKGGLLDGKETKGSLTFLKVGGVWKVVDAGKDNQSAIEALSKIFNNPKSRNANAYREVAELLVNKAIQQSILYRKTIREKTSSSESKGKS